MGVINDINIRELKYTDLVPELLEDFNRYQEVDNVWRTVNGKKLLVRNPFVDDWSCELKKEIVSQDFTNCFKSGGVVFGAFLNNKLIAFATLLHEFFGSQNQYIQLLQLHISYKYRRLGLGKSLFTSCVCKAREWGARKLYISGHSAEETQRFYKTVGCVEAIEINNKIAEHEPFDCQLEFLL